MPRFSKADGEMLHKQVTDYVREKIYSRQWGVNEPIPSEHELMDMLQLSRGTVQKGIAQLVDEGLLVKQRGRGTFVTQPVMTRPSSNRLFSFGESMSAQGIEYVTRVVEHRVEQASSVCAENLGIQEGENHLYLVRVRYVKRLPVMLIESHLSLSACPGLEKADLESFMKDVKGDGCEAECRLFDQIWFNAPVFRIAEGQTKAGGRAYAYYFTAADGHGTELEIIFSHPNTDPAMGKVYDETFAKTMRRLWVQFAKTGDPSLSADMSPDKKAKECQLYDPENRQVLVLDEADIHTEPESGLKIVDWERMYGLTKYYLF